MRLLHGGVHSVALTGNARCGTVAHGKWVQREMLGRDSARSPAKRDRNRSLETTASSWLLSSDVAELQVK